MFIILLTGCMLKPGGKKKLPASSREERPNLVFESVVHRHLAVNGDLIWILQSKKEESYDNRDVIFLYDFRYTEYKNGEILRVCEGDKAKVSDLRKSKRDFTIEIMKSAWVKDYKTKNTLKAEKLIWNNKKGQLSTDSRVEITKRKGVTVGRGMVADKNLENMVLKKHIYTRYSE